MEEIGRLLDLKIEWTEEVGFGTYPEGLKTKRYDAVCGGVWPTSTILKVVDFTDPVFYIPVGMYVKPNDNRFDYNLDRINKEDVIISFIDGTITQRVSESDFPNAKVVSLPQMSPSSEMFLNVTSGKADITFTDTLTANSFLESNPGTLKQVPLNNPLRIFGNTSAVLKGEQEFLNMINYATEELNNSGILDKILKKYEKVPGTLIGVDTNYRKNKK